MGEGGISVLIVDDSAVVRVTLETLLKSCPAIRAVDTAADPYVAAQRMRKRIPDVIILDLQMPRMDGLTFLRRLMAQRPLPVVVCSAHAGKGSHAALDALESGAVGIIEKPAVGTREFLEESRELVIDAVLSAASARVDRRPYAPQFVVTPKMTADAVIRPGGKSRGECVGHIVGIGASTGGTEALRAILAALPPDMPPIVVVQHMPAHFTTALAARLDRTCPLRVQEAAPGDIVEPRNVYIAPGDRHMTVERSRGACRIEIVDGPRVNRHRPSVDVLFRSLALDAGAHGVGVLLTGMGDDGAAGLLEMHEAGARTIAQDEESSVVFGMPAAAIDRGAADEVAPLAAIPARIVALTRT